MNQLRNGAAWLADQLDRFASVEVLYKRESLQIPMVATKGRSTFEQLDSSNMMVLIDSQDFIVTASRLSFNGQSITPRPGDQIIESSGSGTTTFEVNAFGTNQCFKACDPFGIKLRIFTKKIAVFV